MKNLSPAVVLIICLVISGAVSISLLQKVPHCNSASRMATIESLVHRGTFRIDDSPFSSTADKVFIEGHVYSSKPPVLSVLAAGWYFIFNRVTGYGFHGNESLSLAYVNLIMGVLPYLLMVYFFYRFLLLWTDSRRAIVLGLLVFTLNFIGLGYATDLNNHTPAAACLLISFYLAYTIRRCGKDRAYRWLLSGFLAGLASAFEFWSGIFALSFAVYLLGSSRRKTFLLFITAAAIPVAAHFILNLAATGSLLPPYLRPELYQFRGGYWTEPTGIDAIHEPRPIYFFNLLLGHHGLLSMTPVFLLSFWSMFQSVRRRDDRFAEALAAGIPTVITIAFLGMWTRNYGGVCAGLRWMILAMPLLFLFTARWIEQHSSRRSMVLLAILALIGLVMLADVPWASAGPWHNSAWHKYVFGLY